jgi:starvation-inducible DNA-binding protein
MAREYQPFGVLAPRAIALPARTCARSVESLNHVLVDLVALRELYRKHHWQASGPTFYSLHLLFDSHYEQLDKLVDDVAERIAALGGVSVASPHDVAELTRVPRPPRGREAPPLQLRRLLEAHEITLSVARAAAKTADDDGDAGTNDLLVGQVIRTNEKQAWFVAETMG